MKVFITGASGFIGRALVTELIASGHQVVGLARSDASANALSAAGASVHRGSLDDLGSLRSGAAASDGVIHLAYFHQFSHASVATRLRIILGGSPRGIVSRFMATTLDTDRHAIDTFGDVLAGSNRPLLIASALFGIARNPVATEQDQPTGTNPRTTSEQAVLAMSSRKVRSVSVRLAPSVHGKGDHGLAASLIETARKKGASAYVGDGSNCWPAVHQRDAAHLFRLALEKAPAGSVLHGVAEEGIPTRAIAEVIGRHLNVPVSSIPRDKAIAHFGWLGDFFASDIPTSSALTRKLLDWQPTQIGLIADLDEGHYFNSTK